MHRLTDTQASILSALEKQVAEGELNFAALAQGFGISAVTLREHLDAVARKGYLEITSRGRGRSPVVRLLHSGVPVLGHIAAGPLSEALEFPEGYLRLASYPGRFGLRVKGHSMADLIRDGDVVLLTKRPYKSGEVCAVRVDRSDATLKYVEHDPHTPETVLLRPHNPDYTPQEVAVTQLEVDGVFSALLRGDVIDELLEEPVN
jgi:repressor LexA